MTNKYDDLAHQLRSNYYAEWQVMAVVNNTIACDERIQEMEDSQWGTLCRLSEFARNYRRDCSECQGDRFSDLKLQKEGEEIFFTEQGRKEFLESVEYARKNPDYYSHVSSTRLVDWAKATLENKGHDRYVINLLDANGTPPEHIADQAGEYGLSVIARKYYVKALDEYIVNGAVQDVSSVCRKLKLAENNALNFQFRALQNAISKYEKRHDVQGLILSADTARRLGNYELARKCAKKSEEVEEEYISKLERTIINQDGIFNPFSATSVGEYYLKKGEKQKAIDVCLRGMNRPQERFNIFPHMDMNGLANKILDTVIRNPRLLKKYLIRTQKNEASTS